MIVCIRKGDHRSSVRHMVRIRQNPMRIRIFLRRTGNARPYDLAVILSR